MITCIHLIIVFIPTNFPFKHFSAFIFAEAKLYAEKTQILSVQFSFNKHTYITNTLLKIYNISINLELENSLIPFTS